MKIKKEHLDHMREKIAPLDTTDNRQRYKAAGLSWKRYAWDLLRAAGLIPWVCDTLYKEGLFDSHIDTALRAIVKSL